MNCPYPASDPTRPSVTGRDKRAPPKKSHWDLETSGTRLALALLSQPVEQPASHPHVVNPQDVHPCRSE